MNNSALLESILQATSDKKIEWLSFRKFDQDKKCHFHFAHAQHFNADETLYCEYKNTIFFLVSYRLIDFVRNAVVSQMSLITIENGQEETVCNKQIELHELKSLIFLNSLD